MSAHTYNLYLIACGMLVQIVAIAALWIFAYRAISNHYNRKDKKEIVCACCGCDDLVSRNSEQYLCTTCIELGCDLGML